ncbi:MAG: DUF4129 domain-containing protein [Chitinophagaceae bacterium]
MNKILICFLLLLSCARVVAQEEPDTVVSSVVAPPTVDNEDGEQTVESNDSETVEPSLRVVPDSVVNSLKRDKKFEYANDAAYWKVAEPEKSNGRSIWELIGAFFSSQAVAIIGYILLGALLLFVLYRIIIVNNLYFNRSSRKLKADTGDEIADIHEPDLDEALRQAIADKNHRLAVRNLYLKTLRALDEKGWIHYHAQTTNNEYLLQVTPHGHTGEFRFLTYAYDYVWYGGFELTDEQFSVVHDHFLRFFKVLNP